MTRIRKNSSHSKTALRSAVNVRSFSLHGGFVAEPIEDVELARRILEKDSDGKLFLTGQGTYTLRVHSNQWYEFETGDAIQVNPTGKEADGRKFRILQEAVNKAVEHGRPFRHFWLYDLPTTSRQYFASMQAFEEACDVLYRYAIEDEPKQVCNPECSGDINDGKQHWLAAHIRVNWGEIHRKHQARLDGLLSGIRGLLDMATDNRTHGPEIDAACAAIELAESGKSRWAVGDRVICNGYEGAIGKVCEGQLSGMYEVRLSSGVVCVDGSALREVAA
jgi:hypothetical protein